MNSGLTPLMTTAIAFAYVGGLAFVLLGVIMLVPLVEALLLPPTAGRAVTGRG